MKTLRKILSVAVSLMMVFSLMTVVNADTTYTLTINDTTAGHTYSIYQIFTGEISEKDGKNVLSNIKYGSNYQATGKNVGDLVPEAEINEITDAAAYAKAMVGKVSGTAKIVESQDGQTVVSELAPGYYLVKETGTVPSGETKTAYILQIVGNAEVKVKSEKPSFEKKVKDTNDTTGEETDWQDSADYHIGDAVPFKLEATVAADYAKYEKYYLRFHDKEEAGLTFDSTSVEVYVINGENEVKIETGYSVVTNTSDGCTFEVVIEDAKQIESIQAGSKVVVKYSSTLNDSAVVGNTGNLNQAKLEYSNNPNNEQDGDQDGGDHGNTPWDNVIVFTWTVVVNKVDQNEAALPGAEFTLQQKLSDGTLKTIDVVKNTAGTEFTFKGLDEGEYVLTETTTPTGYNTIAPITFTVNAEHAIEWNGENRTDVVTTLNGEKVSGEIEFTPNLGEGTLTSTVVNKAGTTLPETGGMGTTMLYVGGSVLMLGAAILLISKKRMSTIK